MKKITLISFCLAAFAFASCAGGGCPATGIIPAPQQVTWGEGAFRMPAKLFYTTDLDGQDKADLAAWMQRAADGFFPASFAEASDGDMPALELLRTGDGAPESYRLDVSRTKITLTAPDAAGLFYGLQSLAQLAGHHGRRIPAVTIVDAPRFGYRGFMLDVSRHFRDKEFVERQLDNALLRTRRGGDVNYRRKRITVITPLSVGGKSCIFVLTAVNLDAYRREMGRETDLIPAFICRTVERALARSYRHGDSVAVNMLGYLGSRITLGIILGNAVVLVERCAAVTAGYNRKHELVTRLLEVGHI